MSLIESEDAENLISILQRALFYEAQYRTAMLSDALSFYDVNLTKDLIESDFFYKDINGDVCSVLQRLGMSAPCKFSDFIDTWGEKMVAPEKLAKYPFFKNVRETLLEEFSQGKRDYLVEYWAETDEGRRIFIKQRFLLIQSENGEVFALSIVKDGTEIQLREEQGYQKQLEQYAYYDPVTHGYNYIRFKEKLKEINIPGSIISMDIHSFKIINTLNGILVGDKVIEGIWRAITNVLVFKTFDLAGHINGDHFILFIPSFDEESVIIKLKAITIALGFVSGELNVPNIEPYYGVTKWAPGKKIELAYSEAVAAKKNAKSSQGRNYAFFDESDTVRQIKEKVIIDEFESALAKKEFKIWFQPKYCPVNRRLVGAEALVRWIKNDGSIISPAEFIPLFERNGMIREFDEYIFRNVCMQLNQWEVEGLQLVPISVNLSRVSLYYPKIVEEYKRVAEEIGIDKSFLPIEITESAAVTNNEIKDIADKFYSAGFSLHMDDFGSGYSSLATLNIMHFDTLKLDKSLIDYIGNFGGDRLLEHTILLAKELGMHVTAEGVETENQVRFLRHIGCDSIQGYVFSKPLPAEKFELLLERQSNLIEATDSDNLNDYINVYKASLLKPALYTFMVNLSKNEFMEPAGTSDWRNETKIEETDFDEATRILLKNFILPEYAEEYAAFMNRERMINQFKGKPVTQLIQYERKYRDGVSEMRILAHTFSVEESEDIWLYFTVSRLS